MSSGAELPTGTVTFLFTDVEGSTRLLRELRDDYATALADHQRIVRAALEAHSGWEIDTQGDSFFAAFRRAKDAVGAALETQRDLAAGWRRRRVVMGGAVAAALIIALVLAIALTRGSAQASGEISANSV